MGGVGSGRVPAARRKNLVEDGLRLSVRDLLRLGLLPPRAGAASTIRWSTANEAAVGQVASVEVAVETADEEQIRVRFVYVVMVGGVSYRVEEPVDLISTPQHLGGERWWFCCPAMWDDSPCGRLVGTLYLPAEQKFFACRHCHALSYQRQWTGEPRKTENPSP